MPIHTKKAAIRNREVFFNNQISNVFVNNGGTVSINPDAIPKYESKTATTSLAVSGTYRIPLVSSTSGNQALNTSASLLYNTNTNTLTVPNLTTTYLPQCSQVPTETNQLVNKAYLDQYVGSYNQLWIYDDWLTGDVSGSLNWSFVNNSANQSSFYIIPSEPGHAGIVRLRRGRDGFPYIKLYDNNISFYSTTIKCVRFMVRPFPYEINSNSIASADVRLYLGRTSSNNPTTTDVAYWHFNGGSGLTDINADKNWSCTVGSETYNYNKGTLANKWVLFEIEFNQQIPSFYITVMGETSRTKVGNFTTIISSIAKLDLYIFCRRYSNPDGQPPAIDIDYVDITYNKI
jgi:hypothetical protein